MAKGRRSNGEGTRGWKIVGKYRYYLIKKNYKHLKNPKEFYGRTQKEAEEKVKAFESNPMNAVTSDLRSRLTLGEYLIKWLNQLPDIRERTYDTYENKINSIIINAPRNNISGFQMHTITSDMLSEYLNSLCDRYSQDTIYKIYNYLKNTFALAFKEGTISNNPMLYVNKPKKTDIVYQKKEIVYLDDEDIELLYKEAFRKNKTGSIVNNKAGTYVYGRNAYAVIFLMETGLRVGEFLALKHEDIDLKHELVHVTKNYVRVKNRNLKTRALNTHKKTNLQVYTAKVTPPKTKASSRYVFLTERAIEAYKLLCVGTTHRPKEYIALTNKKTHMSSKNIGRTLHGMTDRAGCKQTRCSVHGLRHTFATNLMMQGLDIETISILLGHATVTITQNVYVHINNKIKVKAANKARKLNNEKATIIMNTVDMNKSLLNN